MYQFVNMGTGHVDSQQILQFFFTFFGKFLCNLLNFIGAFDFTDKWMLTQVTGVNSQPFLMELSGTLVPFLQSFDK